MLLSRAHRKHPSGHPGAASGAIAGTVAAAAYAAAQELDMRIFRHNADDLILVGGLFTRNRRRARQIGLGMHLINGAAFGVGYAVLLHDRLPGPPALRGIAFGLTEMTVLYPLALFEESHPAIQAGILGRYWNRTAFWQSVARHVVFGAVLGPLTARLQR